MSHYGEIALLVEVGVIALCFVVALLGGRGRP